MLPVVVAANDLVRTVAGGVSVFRVIAIEGDMATIESIEDVPGRYPFSMPTARLVPAADEA